MSLGETYEEFVEKFKPKRTTDDCYTPQEVYEVIKKWVGKRYGVKWENFVRPFWPGANYKSYPYKSDSIVVDNPPFSILSQICRYYNENGIRFFLFAPTLTLFGLRSAGDFAFLICGQSITYENGAKVNTSFVTNLEPGCFYTTPDLNEAIKQVQEDEKKKTTNALPVYDYPDNVVSAATIQKLAKRHVNLRIDSSEYILIRALDNQRKNGKAIFGNGFLLSDKAAADKAAVIRWELSEREKEIIRSLRKNGSNIGNGR